jgi:hypothetical protein
LGGTGGGGGTRDAGCGGVAKPGEKLNIFDVRGSQAGAIAEVRLKIAEVKPFTTEGTEEHRGRPGTRFTLREKRSSR